MRKHRSIDAVGTALMTALGFLGGCGGSTAADSSKNAATADAGSTASAGNPTASSGNPAASSGNPAASSGNPGTPPANTATPTANTTTPTADAGPTNDATVPAMPVSTDAAKTCQHPCGNPSPVLVGGADTGFDTCQDGTLRRRALVDCPVRVPRTGTTCSVAGSSASNWCKTDAECTASPNGYCSEGTSAGQPGTCVCNYGCVHDSDCKSGEICQCGDPVGKCVQADCTSGASCEAGCDCVLPSSTYFFSCQTPADTCISDTDCAEAPTEWPAAQMPTVSGSCAYSGTAVCRPQSEGEAWATGVPPGLTCQPNVSCGTGRPFLVQGTERLAASVARTDWRASNLEPNVAKLSPANRARAAAHWTQVGLMEHASIAAFARFTLHLLALAAPPDLVMDSQRAMGDETEHTRLAFALASTYAERELGPGALAIDGALDGFDIDSFVATLVREGCIGETLAAVEATESLTHTIDPAVRRVLEIIARDELRHAELAWRTLGWLVSSGRLSAERAWAALTPALHDLRVAAGSAGSSEDLSELGVLGGASRDALRSTAAEQIIERCGRALLGEASGQRGAKRGDRHQTNRVPSVTCALSENASPCVPQA